MGNVVSVMGNVVSVMGNGGSWRQLAAGAACERRVDEWEGRRERNGGGAGVWRGAHILVVVELLRRPFSGRGAMRVRRGEDPALKHYGDIRRLIGTVDLQTANMR